MVSEDKRKYVRFHILENIKRNPDEDKMLVIMSVIDMLLRDMLDSNDDDSVKPTCKKRCNFCCYMPVEVMGEEARVIQEHVNNHKHSKPNRTVLKKQNKFKTSYDSNAGSSYWPIEMSHEVRKCAFLKDKECSIYDVRPIPCRIYLSVDPPSFCDSKSNPDKVVRKINCNFIWDAYTDVLGELGFDIKPVHLHKKMWKIYQ